MAISTVIVEEQTGAMRRVELSGAALPLQGANWSGSQLIPTAWNPGNPNATQHVLGPQEVPSHWDFQWNTTRIVRTPVAVSDAREGTEYNIERAYTLANLLEDIFRGGALLKVVWASAADDSLASAPRIVRLGRAETWDFNYVRPDDINASVTFSWVGRALPHKRNSTKVENLNANLTAAINAAEAAVAAIELDAIKRSASEHVASASTFTLGQLEAIANGPKTLMNEFAQAANGITNRLKRLGDLLQTVKETPAAILGRIVDIANNAVSVANTFVDTISREGPETQSTRQKLNVLTSNAAYFSGAQTQAEYMAEVMERLAETARSRQTGLVPTAGSSRSQNQMRAQDAFQVHIPRAGETMYTISAKYYGTPDLADELSVANGLPAYTVTPPRMSIIVPSRRNLEEANRNRV